MNFYKHSNSWLKFIKNLNLYFIPPAVQGIFSIFVLIPISTYYLQPEDFGIIAIILSILATLGNLSISGAAWVLGAYQFRVSIDELKELNFSIILIDLVFKTLVIILYLTLSEYLIENLINFENENLKIYFYIAAAGIWFSLFWPSVSQMIMLQGKVRLHFYIEMVKWLINTLVTILCLVVFNLGLISILLGIMFGNMISFILEIIFIINNIKVRFSLKLIKKIFVISIPSIPTTFSENISLFAERYFVQKYLSIYLLGIFTHAQHYFTIFKLLQKAIFKTLYKETVEKFSQNKKKVIIKFQNIIFVLNLFSFLLGLPIIFLSEWFVDIIANGKFNESAIYIPILYSVMFCFINGSWHTQYLAVMHKAYIISIITTSTRLLFIPIVGFFTYYYGLMGTCLSIVIPFFITNIMYGYYAIKSGSYIRNLRVSALFTFLYIGILLIKMFYLNQ